MGKTFRNVRLCTVGQLEDGDKIPRWVRANGGSFQRNVDESCTHLVATEDAYKSKVEAVEKAKELGTVKIVSFDWLEDSLLQKSRRPKPEAPYLLETLTRPVPKSDKNAKSPNGKSAAPKAARKSIKDPFIQKAKKGSKGKRPSKLQVYTDPNTGERWSAILTRPCKSSRFREKYQVTIFENGGERRFYPTYAKYSRIGASSVEMLAATKSSLALATATFKDFFKLQTGKEWEERGDGRRPPAKTDFDGNILPAHEQWYTFEDNASIFTKFIMEVRPASIEHTSAPEMGDASNNGGIDSEPSEYVFWAVDQDDKVEGGDSGNDGDLESCADGSDPIFHSDDTTTETYDSWKIPQNSMEVDG